MKRVVSGEKQTVNLRLNGEMRTGNAQSRTLLSDFLRHELHAYGTHVGCEHGVCGACTVMLDGRLARACMTFAVQADGASVTTIEGLSQEGALNALQQAFSRHGALQCGFCTPGVLISVTHFLQHVPRPGERQVRAMLSGHLCRCTGYEGMVRAVLEIAGPNAAAQTAPRSSAAPDGDDRR